MRMHNLPHPGEVLRELCLEPLGLSVTKAARALGVARSTLSKLLNGRTGITPEMAMRLSIAFDTTPESWMNQQVQYDLWQAERRRDELKVRRLVDHKRAVA
jgi:addiction module HigA family antidote